MSCTDIFELYCKKTWFLSIHYNYYKYFRFAEIQTDIILEDDARDINKPKVLKAILSACEVSLVYLV